MKQLSLSSYMILRKTLHIKKVNKAFYKEKFLKKKKKRLKGFFIFMAMLSLKQVKSNYGKKLP